MKISSCMTIRCAMQNSYPIACSATANSGIKLFILFIEILITVNGIKVGEQPTSFNSYFKVKPQLINKVPKSYDLSLALSNFSGVFCSKNE